MVEQLSAPKLFQGAVLLLVFAVTGSQASCLIHSAKWNDGAPRVTQPSKTDPSKVMVDWSSIIVNPKCAEKYYVWVWKDGTKKAEGQQHIVTDKNVHTKIVNVEPCVYTNIRVELTDDKSDEKDKKDSDTARYNSAALPSFNSTNIRSQFRIGYFQDKHSADFDLSKVSLKFPTSMLTFPQCIKHIELTGKPIAGAAALSAKTSTSQTTTVNPVTLPATINVGWQPFGAGRQLGQLGWQPSRTWGYNPGGSSGFNPGYDSNSGFNSGSSSNSGYNPGSGTNTGYNPGSDSNSGYNPGSGSNSGFNSGSPTTSRPSLSGTTAWGYNPAGRPPTDRPGGGWSYSTTSRPDFDHTSRPSHGSRSLSSAADGAGSSVPDHTPFTNQFLRVSRPPLNAKGQVGPVKSTPPFAGSEVEIVVPVTPCELYDFEVSIVSPTNSVIGKVSDLRLASLADIPDYIPPPLTTVMQVDFIGGGKHTVGAQKGSKVPESCLVDYMEAVDAYANRLEQAANSQQAGIIQHKKVQTAEEVKVELTQAETLSKFGCVCASPRLEFVFDDTPVGTPVSYDAIKRKNISPVFGVYLYEGMHGGKPYYRLDMEKRSTKEFANAVHPPAATVIPAAKNRRRRFIGRVDGGPSTTTRLPWNYGVAGGGWGHTTLHYPTGNWGLTTTTSRYAGTPGMNWQAGATSTTPRSASIVTSPTTLRAGGWSTTTVTIPIIRETTPVVALVPRFIFWDSQHNQWLVGPQLGGADTAAEFGSGLNTKSKCPADLGSEVWQTRSGSLRSGSGRWVEEPAVKLNCAALF